MQLLVLILKRLELVDELIKELAEAGLHGGTMIDSTGMASVLENYEDFPMFGMLRKILDEGTEKEMSKMMLFVIKDEELEMATKVIKGVTGDLNGPNKGIMFSIPVSYVEGLGE